MYLENAGGSQMPRLVADAMRDYMLETFVQLGAGYAVANKCDEVVAGAHAFMEHFVNGAATGRVILGPSTTQLVTMLAGCYAACLEPGDQVVVMECGHEANIGPWTHLERSGVRVRTWPVDPGSQSCPVESLAPLLSDRTRIVALVHVSNLLGAIVDVEAVTRLVHESTPRGRVVVDGVAYAPHRAIDVAAWDVDWYVCSMYKVYGPHMAAMYGRSDAIAELEGPNHFFIARDDVPYKFEPGGVSHEGCAALLGLREYLAALADTGSDTGAGTGAGTGAAPDGAADPSHAVVRRAYELMEACERAPLERLLGALGEHPRVRLVGPRAVDAARVGTVSFVHETRSSADIVAAAHARDVGIRHGHMYAYRLCRALGIEPEDGVVRVSLVHYNTVDEVDRLLEALDAVL